MPVPIVLGSATLAAALAGALLARPRVTVAAGAARATPMLGTAALETAALGTAAALTVSLGLNLGYPAALGLDLTFGAALLVSGARAGRRRAGVLLAACGAVVLLHTVAWALAATPATLVTLAAAAVAALTAGLLAAAALASPVPSGAVLSKAALSGAALLTAAEMFALARAAHAPVARAGFLFALAGLGVVAAGTARRRRPDGPWLEVSGALAYVAGLTAALADPGWTSYTLAAGGLAALAVALGAERRRVAWVGAALLTGSGWVRLSLERVGAPEAYLAPLGAVAIGLGHLRRTRDPAVSSWRAYGAGLGLALLPSLLVILDGDPGLARPLLLGVAALVALLAGARARLAAPLIVGAGVLGVDAAVQLAPLAAALPRWVSIGAIGLLLLALGATYERRLRDLRRLRASLSRLS